MPYSRIKRRGAAQAVTCLSGITLIETLLASALGALLLIALLGLYQRGLSNHAFAESRMETAETLFIAERAFTSELRRAGALPCGRGGARFNLVRGHQTTPWLRLFQAPVQTTPDGDGDELTVLKTGTPVPLVEHNPAQAQLTVTHPADFERGGLLVVCDDDFTVLLQITSDAGRVLGYDHDVRVRPGNCATAFVTAGCGPEGHRFMPGALVASYQPVVFFVSDARSGSTLSRKRLVSTHSKSGVRARLFTESLIENIALLRVQVGVANLAARVSLTRSPPADFGERRPVLLDVGLIATAPKDKTRSLPDASLYLLGENIGGLLDASEHRLVPHEFSVAL